METPIEDKLDKIIKLLESIRGWLICFYIMVGMSFILLTIKG